MVQNLILAIDTTNLFEARKDRNLMRVLYALTLRGQSSMRTEMSSVINDDLAKKYHIITAKAWTKIVGWVMVFPGYPVPSYEAYFYISKSFRRRGIGSILFHEASKHCASINKRMLCSPWDLVSSKFFSRHKANIL